MSATIEVKEEVVVLFAGDSGDGMQLTGSQFTSTHALFGNDVSTFPNFPAEIRAPQGTVNGVSGFQVKFGSNRLYTPGDEADVLVAMNAAAFKANRHKLKTGGILIANTDGFDAKNLKLAEYGTENPLEGEEVDGFEVYAYDITKLTLAAVEAGDFSRKDASRSKNMYVLGFLYWLFDRSLDPTLEFIQGKFKKYPELVALNEQVLKAGYHFGETSEAFSTRYRVKKAAMEPGVYRNIVGNQGTALGLIAASQVAGLQLFYGSYPITPASDILHELSKHRNFGVKAFQAEDEIAACTAAIGASFGGALGATASSGPGIALKAEALGLAVMLELPLVVCNVQRGGPSTGLPTKTEQADLFQALYGRNGEAPMPVVAAHSPHDAFETAYEACRLALEFMTPVLYLSDGYIANGAEPWRYPQTSDLAPINAKKVTNPEDIELPFLPYARNEDGVRPWAIPGTAGLEHRIGGLEKQDGTGNISYDPDNHERMVRIRAAKVDGISEHIPEQTLDQGQAKGKVLVLGWGSTYGAIKTAMEWLLDEGYEVAHAHLRYIHPFPKNLEALLNGFEQVLIPEMNNGQLTQVIQGKFARPCISYTKIKGIPFTAKEIRDKVLEVYPS